MSVESYPMWVSGQWRAAADAAEFACVSPIDGKEWARVPLAGGPDVDAAVKAAREAFDHGPWGTSAPVARAAVLRRLGDLITESAADLADIQVRENGKLIREVADQAKALGEPLLLLRGRRGVPIGETLRGQRARTCRRSRCVSRSAWWRRSRRGTAR